MSLWAETKPQEEAQRICKMQFRMIIRELKKEIPEMMRIYGMEDFLWRFYEVSFIDGMTEACQQIKVHFDID